MAHHNSLSKSRKCMQTQFSSISFIIQTSELIFNDLNIHLKANAHGRTFSRTLYHVFARESCRRLTFPRTRSLISVETLYCQRHRWRPLE